MQKPWQKSEYCPKAASLLDWIGLDSLGDCRLSQDISQISCSIASLPGAPEAKSFPAYPPGLHTNGPRPDSGAGAKRPSWAPLTPSEKNPAHAHAWGKIFRFFFDLSTDFGVLSRFNSESIFGVVLRD